MRRLGFAVGVAAALMWMTRGATAPEPDNRMPARGDISAPVHYEDTMLVLVSEKGVAAVTFPKHIADEGRRGVAYRYRFHPAGGGKEETGEGEAFEGRDAKNQPDRAANRTVIKAGPISLVWSLGDNDRGWVYYAPEKVQVLIATAKRLEGAREPNLADQLGKINLSRFRK